MVTKYAGLSRISKKPCLGTSDPVITQFEQFDLMRKPEIGMKNQFEQDLKTRYETLPHLEWCYYCGDAAGRPSDFSDSDKEFARKLGVTFKLPEEVFT